ncbi:hypothetical protein [Flavihumibacter fluvii]|uniref:hypothetical protein n=1 Tax=Flavihumibacter fluvii TaxID=2838157 RepID=UPI001BDDF6E5|nr:hypothetical protein [Flavihumibacter fluvii]ULQ53314.1 hypothetical protein KJS93_03160 [Flavihumibacter fluvii]
MKTILNIIHAFVGLTATISGIVLMIQPGGRLFQLDTTLLDGSPFNNFLIPGIILAVAVGGTNLLALGQNILNRPNSCNRSILAGVITCGWIICQVYIIHTVFWVQIIYVLLGILTILIAYQLKGKWLV